MPLIKSKSKQAFSKNVKAEMDAGKPQKQSLAIAFSVARHSKKKKMALGGAVEENPKTHIDAKENKAQRQGMKDSWGSGDDVSQTTESTQENKTQRKKRKDSFSDGSNIGSSPTSPMEDKTIRNSINDNAKGSKYALSGSVEENPSTSVSTTEGEDEQEDKDHPQFTSDGYAKGGNVMNPKLSEAHKAMPEADEHYANIADAILAKKKQAKMYAEGGMVDIDENAEEQPNEYYDRNEDAVLKENYDSDMDGVTQPEDSNEHGDPDNEDADSHDMVSQIRKKIKYRRSDLG